jgi:hypothetical protein
MRASVAISTIVLAAACGTGEGGGEDAGEGTDSTGESTGAGGDACERIAGHQYRSVEELECGLGPGGPELCNWTLEFDTAGHFAWYLSDFMESGSYYCNGLMVFGAGNTNVTGSLDPASGILSWDDHDYAQSP